MVWKIVILAACLVYGTDVLAKKEEKDDKRANIYEAVDVGGTYLFLWRQGKHFNTKKCVSMEITGMNKTKRRIYANISYQYRYTSTSRDNDVYYFKTYKNGSSYHLSLNMKSRWRNDHGNFRMNYTSKNKSCFVATEVTKNNTMNQQDVNGCEVWINVTSLPTGGQPVSLDVFKECISLCHKPNLSMHTLNEVGYNPECKYSGDFQPVIDGTWQQDIDNVKKEKEEAKKWREENKDDEEDEDNDEEEEEEEDDEEEDRDEDKEEENVGWSVATGEIACSEAGFNTTASLASKAA